MAFMSGVSKALNEPEVVNDKPLNPHRIAKTAAAKDLIKEVLKFLGNLNHHRILSGSPKARKRARRGVDKKNFEGQVDAVIADLVVSHLSNPASWLRVSRRNQDLGSTSNYKPAFITQKLVDVMDDLALPEMDFVSVELGSRNDNPFAMTRAQTRGTQTRIRAAERLVEWTNERGLKLSDFALGPSEEVIHLKGKKRGKGIWADADLIPYQDTDKTRQMRADLQRINERLEYADIDIGSKHTQAIDLNHRRLRRIFTNGDWESHGRFYDGFWIDLPGNTRRDLLIDDELVAELDFGQMSPRLLYAEVGVKPTFRDAYAVPGFEAHREGVKKLLNSLISAPKPLTRFPKGVNKLLPWWVDSTGQMQVIKNFQMAFDIVSDFHQPIAAKFGKGLSNWLMYRESEIMNKVLLGLIAEDITALPVHDGLLVAESKAERAREVMLEAFLSLTGSEGVVSIAYP